MLRKYRVDLHLHTVLSPCADLLMTPGNIIKAALRRGLDLIAITDHNSAENVAVALEMARNTPLKIIPGMEVESAEEIHLLCLFEDLSSLMEWQEMVYNALPDLPNDEEYFGYQLLTDLEDEYKAKVKRLLATASNLKLKDIVRKVTKLGGFLIPAHVDRPYNSLLSQLGFLPPDLNLPVLGLSSRSDPGQFKVQHPELAGHKFVINSDAHYLNEIQAYMEMKLARPTLEEIFLAVQGLRGRELTYLNFQKDG